MSHETVVQASDRVCADAVKLFAAEISRQMHVRLVVKEADQEVDVTFADEPALSCLRLRWSFDETAEDRGVSDWDAKGARAEVMDQATDKTSHTVRHYGRMLEAIARNREAATVITRRLQGRVYGETINTASDQST